MRLACSISIADPSRRRLDLVDATRTDWVRRRPLRRTRNVMHGTSLSTLLVAATFGFVSASTTMAGTADVVAEARRTLARADGIAAAKMLEDALPDAGAAKDTVLEL